MDLQEFKKELQRVPMTKGFSAQITLLLERYGKEYSDTAESLLHISEKLGLNPIITARKYIYDYLKQLDYFIKNKEYGHNDYNEIRKQIYDDEKTMLDTYMPGLLLSYAYTTILYEKNHLYLNEFLPRLRQGAVGVEVGFGEGFYIWEALSKRTDIYIQGYDISPYALQFADNIMNIVGLPKERYKLMYGNVFEGLNCGTETMDFATLAEVIEHIPQPEVGLGEVVRLMKKGGYLYLTTVIDSNHMDHISNFKSPAVVEKMLEDVGMKIVAKKIYHMRDDFPESNDISIGLSYVAEKIM
jgi:ubiquinone/menaquinone biosynthesis C-methylase UbiE